MTTRPEMHVDDYGTDFELAVLSRSNNKPLPLAGTLIRLFLFQPPTVEAFMREAELLTPPTGADGKLVYTFEDGDITEAGTWYVQALIQDDDGRWHTDIESFEVGANIEVEGS